MVGFTNRRLPSHSQRIRCPDGDWLPKDKQINAEAKPIQSFSLTRERHSGRQSLRDRPVASRKPSSVKKRRAFAGEDMFSFRNHGIGQERQDREYLGHRRPHAGLHQQLGGTLALVGQVVKLCAFARRSPALNRTTYFLTATSFAAMNHLRRSRTAIEVRKTPSVSMMRDTGQPHESLLQKDSQQEAGYHDQAHLSTLAADGDCGAADKHPCTCQCPGFG